MRWLSLLALLLVLLSSLSVAAEAAKRPPVGAAGNRAGSEQEVLRDFEQILDLWRDGRFEELFERTSGGRDGLESFAKKLASSPRRPACCWEKLQEAQISLKGERSAQLRARLGFDGSVPGTQFITKTIPLKKENGVWTITQSELLFLANYSKKRPLYRYLPVQK